MKYVSYSIGGVNLATSTEIVREIIKHEPLEAQPAIGGHAGIINLRSQFITVFDGRSLLNQDVPSDEELTILVCTCGDAMYGIIVDAVHEIIDIENKDIDVSTLNFQDNEYVKGVNVNGQQIITLVDFSAVVLEN